MANCRWILRVKALIYIIAGVSVLFGIALLHLLLGKLPEKYFDSCANNSNRYPIIDGLRGYLAIFVFIHHFVVTWYWKVSGGWGRPPETFFHNIGKVGVILFFVTTGFLFASQLLRQQFRVNGFDLMVSRFFRIVPLYFFVICALIFIVFLESDWQLHVEPEVLLSEVNKWIFFNGELINAFSETRRVIAGVDWTLKYEWIFYVALPLLAWGIRWSGILMSLFVTSVIVIVTAQDLMIGVIKLKFSFCFLMGWMAAIIIDNKWLSPWVLSHKSLASLIVLLFLICGCFVETYSFNQMVVSGAAFILLASGANLFGLLELKASKILGDLSYGIYLLHGIILYVAFTVFDVIDFSRVGYPLYWVIFVFILTLVVTLSLITHLLIERPFMLMGKRIRSNKKLSNLQ